MRLEARVLHLDVLIRARLAAKVHGRCSTSHSRGRPYLVVTQKRIKARAPKRILHRSLARHWARDWHKRNPGRQACPGVTGREIPVCVAAACRPPISPSVYVFFLCGVGWGCRGGEWVGAGVGVV